MANFSEPQRTLGWSLRHPGFAIAREIVWLQVHDAELEGVDARSFLQSRLAAQGLGDALAFLTARDVAKRHFRRCRAETVEACCLTTVGLANGERVGARRRAPALAGTINTLVHISRRLTDGALVEALSIAAEARTTAILDAQRPRDGLAITGTGTDCIVVACPLSGEPEAWAGLHTAVGEAVGGAVYAATKEGVEFWEREQIG